MDYGTIQDKVEFWLIDLPTGVASEIPGWINQAVNDAEKRHNFRHMESETLPISVDQQRELFTKPSDWKSKRGEPYLFHQDGTTTPISWAQSEAQMTRTYAIQLPDEGNTTQPDEGQPRYLLERESTVDVFPLPDDDSDWDNGLWRFAIPYWAFSAALSGDSDVNFFATEAPYYLIYKAAAIGFYANRDEERGDKFDAKAEREYQTIKNRDKLSRLGDKITLGVHKDVYAGEPRTSNREG